MIEYGLLMPVFVIFIGACLGVLVEALVPRDLRRTVQLFLTFLSIAAAFVATVINWASGDQAIAAVDSLAIDGPTYFMWTILLVFGAVSILLFAERSIENASPFAAQAAAVPGTPAEREAIELKAEHTEVFPLALFALSGMMLFPASNDLITMFVALEILSLPLYLLCGLARRRRLLSQESALKYFLLGALSSAFFLYGAALLYGYAGSFTLSDIDDALRANNQAPGLLLAGMGLIGVGLLFKFGAVPFHSWTPDVYAGAPTAVTALHGRLHQDRGDRRPDAGVLRRPRRRPVGLAAADGDRRRGHDGGRVGAGHHPDRREADARVLLDRPRRLHHDRLRRRLPGGDRQQAGLADQHLVGDVLPGGVRGGDPRRVRAGHHGPRPQWRGDPAEQLGRAGPPVAAGRGDLLDLHAELRRDPADQRVHRQVGGVRGGLERRASSGWSWSPW